MSILEKHKENIKGKFNDLGSTTEQDAKNVDYETAIKKGGEGALKVFFSDVVLLTQLCKDYWDGKYRDVAWTTIAVMAGTLIYIVSPVDFIPDIIPILGLADDAALLALTLNSLKLEIDKYKNWANGQK